MTAASAKALMAIRASKRIHRAPLAYRRTASVTNIGVRMLNRLVEAQGRICPLCDDWLEFDPEFSISHPLRPSIDHVVPRVRGGGNTGNFLAMHRECNCAKADRLPTGCELIWLASVNARLGISTLTTSDTSSLSGAANGCT